MPVIRQMKGELPPLLPGYRVRILDGNHLAGTQRRLKMLRDVAAGALPGQTLVVLDPQLGLAVDVVCGEDGHAQERSLLGSILAQVMAGDLWMADRNFCTTAVLFGIAGRGGCFLIRQHASTLHWMRESRRRRMGASRPGRFTSRPCGWKTKTAKRCRCGVWRWYWIGLRATARRRFTC